VDIPKIQLLLGCFGYQENGFVSCRGCENCILLIDSQTDQYKVMMDYLDSCRLFDKALFEYNSINGFIRNMQAKFDQASRDRTLWNEKEYRLFQKFIAEHRSCGLYVKLLPIDDNKIELKSIEEKSITVKTPNNLNKKIITQKIKLNLRCRR